MDEQHNRGNHMLDLRFLCWSHWADHFWLQQWGLVHVK